MKKVAYDAIADWYDALVSNDNPVIDFVSASLMNLMGDVNNLTVCDLACGQGRLSRALAQQGATVTGIDLSTDLINIAQRQTTTKNIQYIVDNAETLTRIEDNAFDRVICNLALMDIPDLNKTIGTVWRILRQGGLFIFSITHPCFEAPHAEWVTSAEGKISREISTYFQEGFWKSHYAEGVRGKVGAHHRMLSTYINTLAQAGFVMEHMTEPQAHLQSPEVLSRFQVIPAFMIIRCRK